MDLYGYGDFKLPSYHERKRHHLYEQFEKSEEKKSLKGPRESDLSIYNFRR
ncbi:hypothetical protein [Chengkuizengella axinellae]|uniref:Uncharacterized protein n=1 Tax=Chengkuizengella axinellae TaxID=3064388 RepID=A0ABT9IXG9_9BACL|nr:hypothetical protein [Chengkuizengella sp. 2205SS18-9]MDP5274025.1 hypothetical protein [Chengkuizengella sp. 2205SS18-9]